MIETIRELTKCKSCKYWIEEATINGCDDNICFLLREFYGNSYRVKTTKKCFEDKFYDFINFEHRIPLLDKKNYKIEYYKNSIIFKEAGKEKRTVYTLHCHQVIPCDSLFAPTSISIKNDLSTLISKLSIKCELTKHALELLKIEGELKFIMNYVSSPDLVLEYIRRVNEGNILLDLFESYFITQGSVKIKNNKMHIKYSIPSSSLYKPIIHPENPAPLCDSSFLYNGPAPLFQPGHEISDRISMLINIMNNATNFMYSLDSNDMILLIHNKLVLVRASFTTEEFKQAFINKYITDNNYTINTIEKERLIKYAKLHFQSDHIGITIPGLDIIRLPFRRWRYGK